ncbi:MAG: hypothetical protein LBQ61_01180 [Spirochaetales bacterium]|jgi:hypothetical protein|nr:hypothetical protein [Spirochaetales bacterium]
MDSIENVCKELDKILTALSSGDLAKPDPSIPEKLKAASAAAEKLNMGSGKKLIDNLADIVGQLIAGTADAARVGIRVTALDFYVKKILAGDSGAIEEL